MDEVVRIGGRRVKVRRNGCGPAVVLLNGVLMRLSTWEPLVEHLDGFECIRVTMPGLMDSGGAQPLVTMRGFSSMTLDLLDRLGIERADVLGLSFGGMVAQQLAFDAPERVRRLVLVSTSCGLGAVPSNPMSWWNALLEDAWESSPLLGPLWLTRQWGVTLRREFGASWERGLWIDGVGQQFAAASMWSSLPWLPALAQPTLVIAGTADALVPAENAGILASRIPDARLHRVRGGGHLCLLDRVAEVGPVIADFLRASERTALDQAVELR
ncbi:MAG: alpha/beta fold hydrolase [Actinobacteria bacterium]|nr:alpha/beta fold hydrolase [Actinomycetota bacterium]